MLDEDSVEDDSAIINCLTVTPDSNSEIEKLEQRLQDLRMEGNYYNIYYYILCKIMKYI